MNLHRLLAARAAAGRPFGLAVIGAGKFASMYLAQLPRTPGVRVVGIADLDPVRARARLEQAGWPSAWLAARLPEHATGTTYLGEDWERLVAHPAVDIVIEATGDPIAAVEHALAAFAHGKHVVMVTVETDALCGPVLAQRAREAGVVYSLAYGDQPAMICELVDWARTAGFSVVAAGRGHKWLPAYARSTPETVWEHWGLAREQAQAADLNPKMFNSFLDGSKPAIETAAVCNATGLTPAPWGLAYPPCGAPDLPTVMRPQAEGGCLHHKGQVEVASSLHPDGRLVADDIRMGVWVVFEAETEYVRRCFAEYGVRTDPSGRYASLYKRWHWIGLEAGISIASVGLRREPTGCPDGWRADVAAVAKRNLAAGEILDGEGGYSVAGTLVPSERSLAEGLLPLALANRCRLRRPLAEGQLLRAQDVDLDDRLAAVRLRRELERTFAPARPVALQAAENGTSGFVRGA